MGSLEKSRASTPGEGEETTHWGSGGGREYFLNIEPENCKTLLIE